MFCKTLLILLTILLILLVEGIQPRGQAAHGGRGAELDHGGRAGPDQHLRRRGAEEGAGDGGFCERANLCLL